MSVQSTLQSPLQLVNVNMCTEVVDSGLQVEALVAHTSTRLEEKGILETTENKIIIK